MKILLVLSILVWSTSVFGLTVTTQWTSDYEKFLKMSCSQGEGECKFICGEMSCRIPEEVCTGCVGTSITMTYIFEEMGRSFYNTGKKLGSNVLINLLSSGEFVTLSSKSVYNLIYSFNSLEMKQKFSSLCDDGTAYPIVFFAKHESGRIGHVKAVQCDSGTFSMKKEAQVDLKK